MFFSPELLSKRESGFGLLWLAATLGSKSTFNKLPRKSVITADISQLCNMISQPSEPLALRLSSNLMVGVARVYKIKHEIFLSDVNNCFLLLKKAVHEIHSLSTVSEAKLLMGQPTVRPDTLRLAVDPAIAMALELDTFNASWDEFADFSTQRKVESFDDDEYSPSGKEKPKGKGKQRQNTALNSTEIARVNRHTLDESHEFLLMSTSFDGNMSFAGIDPSSSQIGGLGANMTSFVFEDNLFGDNGDGLGAGFDLGEELARELGEGWGVDAQLNEAAPMELDDQFQFPVDGGFDVPFGEDIYGGNAGDQDMSLNSGKVGLSRRNKRSAQDAALDNYVEPDGAGLQSGEPLPDNEPTDGVNPDEILIRNMPDNKDKENERDTPASKKQKKVRLLLDARTELTDEELKEAREQYVERQQALRVELERKRAERTNDKSIEEMIWGIPTGFEAPVLANFWKRLYKVQVESRSGAVQIGPQDGGQKMHFSTNQLLPDQEILNDNFTFPEHELGGDFAMAYDDHNIAVHFGDDPSRIRSSEEPEKGRRAASRPASLPDGINFDLDNLPSSGTQRSAFFPWDNAAGSSSVQGGTFSAGIGSDRLSLDKADIRLIPRSSLSGSRRESSVLLSHVGSVTGLALGLSPGLKGSVADGGDFRFEVPNEGIADQDTQETLIPLEKTSHNFLEYCKIQINTLPNDCATLVFNDVVPVATGTPRVAASALYHCLVLATKDLISVEQKAPFGPIAIKIK